MNILVLILFIVFIIFASNLMQKLTEQNELLEQIRDQIEHMNEK
ncbi:hypothetical protein BCL52_1199 [Salisediminibacterium halotolerans]|nr:hypothetical protein BCL39_1202 [Actinophytocola xinjiangensis]RPE89538.1 hypothetical protein EDD67_0315 [Salisediminibacterium halotolerans]TWG36297.1 hypothetical protein BCL52_1199 [Salisediminibacterium halotolerans]GEL09168.1 hypothetical protein SHA02_25840 [Salisediminibacterium halotolerans]